MDKFRCTVKMRLWFLSSTAVLLVMVSSHAFAVGVTPTVELLNPQYAQSTSSFTFTLLNREKNPRAYQFESQLYSQGKILKTHKHHIRPMFSENRANENSNFALSATLSIPVEQIAPSEDGIYSLRVIANSRGKTGDMGIARMWIRFQQRGWQVRVLTQSEYTKLIHRPDKSGDVGFSAPNRAGFGKVDLRNASFMLPMIVAAERAPLTSREEQPMVPQVEVRTIRPRNVFDIREFEQILQNRAISMEQLRPSLERSGVFVPPYEPLQAKDRTEVNE